MAMWIIWDETEPVGNQTSKEQSLGKSLGSRGLGYWVLKCKKSSESCYVQLDSEDEEAQKKPLTKISYLSHARGFVSYDLHIVQNNSPKRRTGRYFIGVLA